MNFVLLMVLCLVTAILRESMLGLANDRRVVPELAQYQCRILRAGRAGIRQHRSIISYYLFVSTRRACADVARV